MTVNDPKVFTKPWTVDLHMKPLLDTEMIDFICRTTTRTWTTWCALHKSTAEPTAGTSLARWERETTELTEPINFYK